MQPVRVYKVFLAFYSKSKCWALRASCILRAGFFLGRNWVGKYRRPRDHTLITERCELEFFESGSVVVLAGETSPYLSAGWRSPPRSVACKVESRNCVCCLPCRIRIAGCFFPCWLRLQVVAPNLHTRTRQFLAARCRAAPPQLRVHANVSTHESHA
jgi:hypothetical protein